jgi:Tfp pilus assembly protein PilX
MKRHPSACAPQSGWAVVLVLFALVVAAGLISVMALLHERGTAEWSLALRQARAQSAAQAGLQWGARWIQAAGQPLPPCWPTPWAVHGPGTLAEFPVILTCQRTPESSAPQPFYEEGTRRRVFYDVHALVQAGTPGSAAYVVWRQSLRIERCQDETASVPTAPC